MSHYDEYYEQQDRINAQNKNTRIEHEYSKIISDISNYHHRKGTSVKELKFDMIKSLAVCRVNGFKDNQLDALLTEIVKEFHKATVA